MKHHVYLFDVLRILLLAAVIPATLCAKASLYPDLPDLGPTTNFPVYFSGFHPPVTIGMEALDGTPEVYEYTRDNNAGETMIMTGERFSVFKENYSDIIDIDSIALNNDAKNVATIRSDITWSPDTRIEIECAAYETPNDYGRLFHVPGKGSAWAGIACRNGGMWIAGDGAGGTIELGAYDEAYHTFVYDSQSLTVSFDGISHPLKATLSGTQRLYVACNSPGYQSYPMNLRSWKVWENGVLVEDLRPTIEGAIVDQVDGSIHKSFNQVQGITIPLSLNLNSRTVSYSGEEGLDTQFMVYGKGVADYCDILRMDDDEVAITLPSTLPDDEMYLVWPGNAVGYGLPLAVNQTEAWWVGPDQVSSGKPFTVYGRNLGTNCHVYIEELNQWIESRESNPYAAEFNMPSAVSSGAYTIWVHNGCGLEYGWAPRSLQIMVMDEFAYDGETIDVSNFSSVADAVNESSPGDTIYFPAGTYSLNYVFGAKIRGRKLLGDGIDKTILKPSNPHVNGGILFDQKFYNLFVSNMTIETTEGLNSHLFRFSGDNNVFDTVKLSAFSRPAEYFGNAPFNFINNSHLTMKNCIILNAGDPGNLDIGSGNQIILDGCEFVGSKKCSILLSAWGLEEASIRNCTARPYDDDEDGWFDGRWLVTADYWGAVNNIYFGQNKSTDLAPPKGHDLHVNTGEQVLVEGGLVKLRGNVLATGDTVSFPNLPDELSADNVVTVVAGRGYGQTRKILSIDHAASTIRLSEPWRIIPDAESFVVVASTTYRFVVHDNDLDGKEEWVTGDESTASAGVAIFGGGIDLVIDGNRFTDLRRGIYQWPLVGLGDDEKSVQACFFNTFTENSFSNCWQGLLNKEDVNDGFLDGGILATTFRGNRLDEITTCGVLYDTKMSAPLMKMSVYEDNVFNRCKEYAIKDGVYVENQLFLNNRGTNVNSGVSMSISYNHLPVLKGNRWLGYVEEYAFGPSTEQPPERLLGVPIRVVDVGKTNQIPIWNLARLPLNWTASTDENWLDLTIHSEEVTDQNDEGSSLEFRIIQEELPQADGTVTGKVVVASVDGTQKKIITVVYDGDEVILLDSITYPLVGYSDKTIRAELYDPVLSQTTYVGELANPMEITIQGRPERCFLKIKVYDDESQSWEIDSVRRLEGVYARDGDTSNK